MQRIYDECCTFEACVALIYGLKHSSLKHFRIWTTLQDDIVKVAYTVDREKNEELWQHELCAPSVAAMKCTVNAGFHFSRGSSWFKFSVKMVQL